MDEAEIRQLAKRIRKDVLEMIWKAGVNGGHIGGAFSCAEILACLYGRVMNLTPECVRKKDRDRFLLSKGHVALAHYAVLKELGFISEKEMLSFEVSGSPFPTHAVMCPEKGIEISSGSLGYGLSIGVGCALAAKKAGRKYHTYVLAGDGECNEGSIWEAAMAAARLRLDNLTFIIDRNGLQLDGYTERIMPVQDFFAVLSGFGFHTAVVDGHDTSQLCNALCQKKDGMPTAVIANTIKGKGIPSIEGKEGWHHVHLTQEQYDGFLQELEAVGC